MRELTRAEIDDLLGTQTVGRLGLYDDERRRAYVVPVAHIYRDGAIYLHSAPGAKLRLAARQARGICYEVDEVTGESQWKSAVAWGHFDEIRDPDQRRHVLESFGSRLMRGPLRTRQNVGRGGMIGAGETVFRLVLDEVTGRCDGEA